MMNYGSGYGPQTLLPPGQDLSRDDSGRAYASARQDQEIALQQARDAAEQEASQAITRLQQDLASRRMQAEQTIARARMQLGEQRQENQRASLNPNVRRGLTPAALTLPSGLWTPPPLGTAKGYAEGGQVPAYADGGTQPRVGDVRRSWSQGWLVWDGYRWRTEPADEASAQALSRSIQDEYRAAFQAQGLDQNGNPTSPGGPPLTVPLPPSQQPGMLPPARVEAKPDSPHRNNTLNIPRAQAFVPGVDPYPTEPLTPEQSAAIAKQLEQSGGFAQAAQQFAQMGQSPYLLSGGAPQQTVDAGPSDEMKAAWAAYEKAQKDREKEERERFGAIGGARDSGFGAAPASGWRSYAEGGYVSPFSREYGSDPLFGRPEPTPKPAPVEVKPWEKEPVQFGTGMGYLPPTPAGWKGYSEGGMPEANAIVGEGKDRTGYRTEVVIHPLAVQMGLVRKTTGPTASMLPPGAIILPPQDQNERLVERELQPVGGTPVRKTKKGYRRGGRTA